MKPSIVIPCFNEIDTIKAILATVRAALYPDKEVNVGDNYFTDGARQKMKDALQPQGVIDNLPFHYVDQGKGAALSTGVKAATGDIVIIQDADLEYDPSEYGRLVASIAAGRADVAYGSRFVSGDAQRVLYFRHRAATVSSPCSPL
jgi:glycosyltransferase involved in cell wall biosynthesis